MDKNKKKQLAYLFAARMSIPFDDFRSIRNVSIANFIATDDTRIMKLLVGIDPVQDLHGYDAPWPAGGGKNKLPVTATTQTINGVEFTVNSDGTIKVNGTATANATLVVYGANTSSSDDITIESESVISTDTSSIIGVVWKSSGGTTFNTETYTISAGTVLYGFGIRVLSGETVNNIIVKPMLRLASESSAYSPYSNICPISGFTGLTLSHSGADTGNPTTLAVTWQSEAGTVYGGTLDVVSGLLTATMASKTFNGSETWMSSLNQGYYATLNDLVKTDNYSNLILCDKLQVFNYNSSQLYKDAEFGITAYYDFNAQYPNQNWIYAKAASIVSDAVAFKQWLSNNPITIAYELAAPQTYQLDPVDIQPLLGENNIWADTGDILILDLNY